MRARRGSGVATGTAWTVLLAAADTGSEGPKCPFARVLHGLGASAKPGSKRQTQAGVTGWPDFDPDLAEEPGLIEPYLSAIQPGRDTWRSNGETTVGNACAAGDVGEGTAGGLMPVNGSRITMVSAYPIGAQALSWPAN